MEPAIHILPHVNAALNLLAAVLLVAGYFFIRAGRETAHKRTMLGCFAVSVVFLICYLSYHQLLHAATGMRGRPFEHPSVPVRYFYYGVLISHVLLAAVTPVLAVITIVLGLRGRRQAHRRWARWTFPIWLYVSLTGVVVYLMLYRLPVPESAGFNPNYSRAIYCEAASPSVDGVRRHDSFLNALTIGPAEESLAFLATKGLATSRYDLRE